MATQKRQQIIESCGNHGVILFVNPVPNKEDKRLGPNILAYHFQIFNLNLDQFSRAKWTKEVDGRKASKFNDPMTTQCEYHKRAKSQHYVPTSTTDSRFGHRIPPLAAKKREDEKCNYATRLKATHRESQKNWNRLRELIPNSPSECKSVPRVLGSTRS